ncbi:conjugal transfer protein [Enterococcus faecalis]
MANKVNLAALQPAAKQEKKSTGKSGFFKKKSKKEKKGWGWNKGNIGEGTRSIKFNRTSPNKIVAAFLWFLLLSMAFFLLLNVFTSGSTLSSIANLNRSVGKLQADQKQENETDDFVVYQGQSFLYWYYLAPKTNEEKESRDTWLSSYLSNGLSLPTLKLGEESQVLDIQFTRQETKKNTLYDRVVYLSYEVTLQANKVSTEESQETSQSEEAKSKEPSGKEKVFLQVTVPATITEGDFRVIGLPEIASFGKSSNLSKDKIVPYDGTALYARGEKVADDQQPAMVDFLTKFYQMYAANDEKLNIVTHESGFPTPAEAKNVTIRNLVKTGKNEYKANGTAEVTFETSGIQLSTSFTVTFKQEGNGYFVTTINN